MRIKTRILVATIASVLTACAGSGGIDRGGGTEFDRTLAVPASGTVSDPTGAPIEGTVVSSNGDPTTYVTTDSQGRYELTAKTDDLHQLELTYDGAIVDLGEVPSDVTSIKVDVRLDESKGSAEPTNIEVTVKDPNPDPVKDPGSSVSAPTVNDINSALSSDPGTNGENKGSGSNQNNSSSAPSPSSQQQAQDIVDEVGLY